MPRQLNPATLRARQNAWGERRKQSLNKTTVVEEPVVEEKKEKKSVKSKKKIFKTRKKM